jgi:hypothetical protein
MRDGSKPLASGKEIVGYRARGEGNPYSQYRAGSVSAHPAMVLQKARGNRVLRHNMKIPVSPLY